METSRLLNVMNMKLLAQLVTISLMVFLCFGCASMLRIDGPYEGKVIDADTKQPIVGAVVHGSWSKRDLVGYGEYYDSFEVLTDKNGEFKIPGKGLLVLSKIEEMNVEIFKAGYRQWTSNPWSGLKGKWPNDEVVWRGSKGTFKLQRLTMEERHKRIVELPATEPMNKHRLLRIEHNKEMIETGMPADTLLSVE